MDLMKDFVSLRVSETVPWQVPMTRRVVWPGKEAVVAVGSAGTREGWMSEAGVAESKTAVVGVAG